MADQPNLWTIPLIGNEELVISDVTLLIDYQKDQTDSPKGHLTGQIGGTFALGKNGVQFSILAELTEAIENTGWQLSGHTGAEQGLRIGSFVSDLATKFGGFSTPEIIQSLYLKNLEVSFNTKSKDFAFSGETDDFTINNQPVTLVINIAILHHLDGSFSKQFEGHLTIDPLQFDLNFEKAKNSKRMLAVYHDTKGTEVSLSQLLSNIGVTGVPDVLSFTIKDAALIHEATENSSNQTSSENSSNQTSKNLFLAHIDAGINLAGLPLIGKQFSADKKVELTFQVLYASAAYSSTDATGDEDEIATINGLLPTGINQLQLKEIKQGPSVTTTLRWGKELIPIALPIDTNDQSSTTEPLKADYSVSQPNGSTRNSVSNDSGTWINVQKKLGPVHLHRIGVQYQGQKDKDRLVNDPLGGPAFFFVTGLAVGFGYNRDLLIPPVEQLTSFPLVAQAIRGDGLPPDPGRDTLLQELENLHNYLTPKTDQYFLAVGVKFTTFKIVDSFALVTLAFGKQFAFNLLGLSTLLVPPSMEGKQVDKDPLAEIQVALRATYMPEEGVLKIDALLTPNSYILSRKCRLTGGFAFYSWFKGQHAGDFVVTLGGYHPHFNVPAHYPIVPRLVFNCGQCR